MKQEEKTNYTSSEVYETSEMDETTQNDPVVLEEDVSNEAAEASDTEATTGKGKLSKKTDRLSADDKEMKGRWWLPYVISFATLAVFTVLLAWARGGFAEASEREILRGWCDAFGVCGLLGVFFGLLILISNGGAFDILAYGMRRFFGLFRKDTRDRKYGGYYEYKQARAEKKRSFWYLIIVGGVYLIVGVVLLILYYQV